MKNYRLNEDKLPPKLQVILSPEIVYQIDDIKFYNQFNDRLNEWVSYIEWLINYISNPTIAFSNNNEQTESGVILFRKLGCKVDFYINENKEDGIFIYIIGLFLNLEEYGLRDPSTNESKHNTLVNRIINIAVR